MPTQSQKILIVEDDKFLRELISKKLVNEGFQISQALDGEEGIKKILEDKPDLVLLDLILPGLDGFGVLAKKKENPEAAGIPVIVLSNLSQENEIKRAMDLGAADFLVKAHFIPGEIVNKIKQILNK